LIHGTEKELELVNRHFLHAEPHHGEVPSTNNDFLFLTYFCVYRSGNRLLRTYRTGDWSRNRCWNESWPPSRFLNDSDSGLEYIYYRGRTTLLCKQHWFYHVFCD
jgi:hypothetical protein